MSPKKAMTRYVDIDGTPEHGKLNRSRIHSSKSVRGWGLILTGCIFDGQVRRGELNGVVLVNYLHQVVGGINRYNWHAPEDCYETCLEDICMHVVGATL